MTTVSWTASSDDRGVTGYRIYSGGTLVGLVSGTVTSFIDRTTAPSTAYSYTIAALDAAGNASAQSSAANVTTPSGTTPPDTTAPSTPAGLSGTPVAAGRIDLAWTAATDNVGVAGYNVYRDGVKINTAPVGSISYSDTGLTPGANHTYTVSALDAAGNESSRSATWSGAAGSGAITSTYSYDAENRLTQLQSDSTVIGSYAYDGVGNRYAKTAAGVTTAYTLDLASSLPQVLTETAGSSVTTYAYGGGPLELDKSGTTYWYLSDTLGSVRLVTDSTGASPATYAYAAFGSTRKSSGTLANEVRFSGERTDTESGLEFLRARTYDPSTGTFLQRDSWGISPTGSQSIDAYAYTANNPVNAVDPSGHCAIAPSNRDEAMWCGTSSSGQGAVQGPPAPPKVVDKAVSQPQGRPDCGWNPFCAANNALGTSGDLGRDLGGGLGNAYSDTAGGIVNHPADFLHDSAGVRFDLTIGACAGGSFSATGHLEFGDQLCIVASTDGQVGITNVGGGSGQIAAGGGPTAGLFVTNSSGKLGSQKDGFNMVGGNVKTPWGGGDLEVSAGTDMCGKTITNVQVGPAAGIGGKFGAGGTWTSIIWQSKEDKPC